MLSILAFAAAALSVHSDLTRPTPPTMPTLNAAACEDKASRDRMLAQLTGDQAFVRSMDAYGLDWATYAEARLEQLGLQGAERQAFFDRIAKSPDFIANGARKDALQKQVDDEAKVPTGEDDVSKCKAAVQVFNHIPDMIGIMEDLLNLIDREVEAEAKRRGIKLD